MSDNKLFSEQRYYSAYKKIRNKIRKYNPLSIIQGCLNHLHQPTSSTVDELQKQPWLILLLIKWVLIDENFTHTDRITISKRQLNELFQGIHDLSSVTRLPTDYEYLTLFMRSLAYQQFLYQHPFSLTQLARQKLLFCNLPANHLIQTKFKELTGLSISCFLELGLITSIRLIDKKISEIPMEWFSNFSNEYSQNDIRNFLGSISLPLLPLREKLLDRDNRQRFAHEVLEQTPFLETPLIKTNQSYLCIYPSLLYRCLDSFVYDKLRLWNAERFMGKFGSIFENYVEMSVKHTNLPYINEQTLKNALSSNGNLIDFIVNDGDANIFIDAKAVEMASQGKVSHLSDVVKDKTKNSVIKAIKQAHDVLRQLKHSGSSNLSLKHRSQNYLLVVTYKELYLGNGITFYEAIAKRKIDEIYAEYEEHTLIELGNMYFITIEQFDILAELVKSEKIGFVEALEAAKLNDSEPLKKKFDFGMHLSDIVEKHHLQQPKFISDASDNIFENISRILQEQ